MAASLLVWQVHAFLDRQALDEAQNKARLLLDRIAATHAYFTEKIEPSLFSLQDKASLDPDYFEPHWMSSNFASREIDRYFRKGENKDYYFKHCSINARNPENEANQVEREFIEELNRDPQLENKSFCTEINGKSFLVVMRRGLTMKESCLQCHGTPEQAPKELLATYGRQRSFGRKIGEIVSAQSLSVPLSHAYADADRFTTQLSLAILVVFCLLFGAQFLVHRRYVLKPLEIIQDKTKEFLSDETVLGQQIPLPESLEYANLAESFNKLSAHLRRQIDTLEQKVKKRTFLLQKELTEKAFTEEALQESRSLLLSVLDNSPLLISVKDTQGRFSLTNKNFEVLGGYDPKWLYGKSVYDAFSPELASELTKGDLEVLSSGHILETEDAFVHVDKTIHRYSTIKFPLRLSNATNTQVCSISSDVTEKMEVEKEKVWLRKRLQATWNIARSAEHDFKEICSNILSEALSMTDSRFGFYGVVKKNQTITTIYRWETSDNNDQETVEGPTERFPSIDSEIWARALKGKEAFFDNNYALNYGDSGHPHGRSIDSISQLLAVPIVSDRGDVKAVIVLGNKDGGFSNEDIGAVESFLINVQLLLGRKEAQEEREKLLTQLDQAQKMEAIGTLAGGIAHDFNNILGSILGYSDLILEAAPEGSAIAEDIAKVIKGGYKAKELVRQILTFSRQSQGEPILFRPSTIVKEVIALLRSSIPSTINISQNIDSDTGTILMDPTQLHQIVMNLCTNAFHAMEKEGGKLFIGLGQVDKAQEDFPDFPDFAGGSCVQLTVSDTGVGIAAQVIDRIFDPYFTTKEVGKGTGMGLAIIHGIIKGCKGAITVESSLLTGTTFQVFFPTTDSTETPANIPLKANNLPTSSKSLQVLFVDDEEYLIEVGVAILEELGHKATTCRSGIEALDLFEDDPDKFDLVITDQTMPEMTGVEAAKRMLAIRPQLPIILCTGYSNMITEEQVKELGIRELSFKPLIKKDIAQLIERALAKQ